MDQLGAFTVAAKNGRIRAWLVGVLTAFLLLPGVGHTQAAGRGCRLLDGGNIVTFNLPPSISFALDQQLIPGFPIYISSPYEFRYRCTNIPNLRRQAAISILGDFGPVLQALRNASLRLTIVYDNIEKGQWNPDPTAPTYAPYFSVDAPYDGDSGERLGRIILLLYAERRVTRPLRVFLPPSFAFKLIADETAGGDPGIFLNSSASRFQFIPSCVGAVNVDNTVIFDTVLTTANYNGKLPQAKPFNVTTRMNSPACPGLEGLTSPPSTSNPLDELYLRTAVSFVPQSGERTDLLDQTIYLKNADGQENGLKLTITNEANQTVTLGALPADDHGTFPSRYNGNLGGLLHGTTLSQTQTYTAHLERTTAELKTGKFSTQVLVKVTWF
ncbi:hypothetical protein MXL91_02495 [Achromobacter ruhlandii]|uniref:hypothetical protein n=1 Tax=Achromobacter ruhlandii TaxID=72557 RepID=UPI002DBDA3F7|nr:hypothetical protein [Achromobacter ruhlandii]MEB6660296.1 hypothetical protein [Achromobacter ruhlandii]